MLLKAVTDLAGDAGVRVAAVLGAFAAHLRAEFAMLVIVPLALGGAEVATRAHSSSTSRNTCSLAPVRRTASLPAASHTSAQSRQARMHWLMSIFSAAQASAQLRHMRAQYIR